MTRHAFILGLLTLSLLTACTAPRRAPGNEQIVAVQRGMVDRVTVQGVLRKLPEPASDLLPTYYYLQLQVPLDLREQAGWNASLCPQQMLLESIDLWYGGVQVFAALEGRTLSLSGRIECPRGAYVLRDVLSGVGDGALIRDAVRSHPPHPLP